MRAAWTEEGTSDKVNAKVADRVSQLAESSASLVWS
jgi:hypothetical protein